MTRTSVISYLIVSYPRRPLVVWMSLALLASYLILATSAMARPRRIVVEWTAPTTYTSGEQIDASVVLRYRVYMCDAPIQDDMTCTGTLRVLLAESTIFATRYETGDDASSVYMRIGAYSDDTPNPSALSNQMEFKYDPRAIGTLTDISIQVR